MKAVREVADDDTIHGTLEYEKDRIRVARSRRIVGLLREMDRSGNGAL